MFSVCKSDLLLNLYLKCTFITKKGYIIYLFICLVVLLHCFYVFYAFVLIL